MLRTAFVTMALAASAAFVAPATAQEIKLPSTLTMTAYDTGTSGFNITVAVGKVFKDKHQSTRATSASCRQATTSPGWRR
jgi:hypothetical protein